MIRHVQIHFGLSVCNACASHTLLMSKKHNRHIAKFLYLEMVVQTSSAAGFYSSSNECIKSLVVLLMVS